MTLFLAKLLITPTLLALVTLAGRRWGHEVSGWLTGLPLTSGPISVFLALQHGRGFAADAAEGTLGGLAGFAGYCLVYAVAGSRFGWRTSALMALASFFAIMFVWQLLSWSLLVSVVVVALLVSVAALVTRRMVSHHHLAGASPVADQSDLRARIFTATALVLLITAVASQIGPKASGFLATAPILASVLAVFTHRTHGAGALVEILYGMVVGIFGAVGFFAAVGALITHMSSLATYAIASALALIIPGLSVWFTRRRVRRHSVVL